MVEEEPSPGLIGEGAAEERSLFADIGALVEDGRTLVEAEIAYQKTRASYAARQSCYLVATLAFVTVLLALALMAVVVGVVLALAPILTPWGAGLAVASALCIGALLGLAFAISSWRNLRGAFGDDKE